ncbi:aspartate kinase, partial [bacterium]
MRIIVQKYGGKSVANIDRIRQVASRIVNRHIAGEGLVVVVSAMADTTDELIGYANSISRSPSERELDMLLTAGERISMALLSMAIWDLGHSAISFTGSQSGIITDDVHTRARIVEIRASRIIEELHKGRIVIVAGFQGVSGKREVTTLGRGGSDTTAVALAGALGAERCEIYSDVDGLYSIDPKISDNAIHIDQIDYNTLFDLAFFGAQVIHPRAVEMARKYNIPILLASSTKEGKHTMIKSKAMEGATFFGVSIQPEIIWFNLKIPIDKLYLFWEELERIRTSIRNPALQISDDLGYLNFWTLPANSDEIEGVLKLFPEIESKTEKLALISISGWGLAESPQANADII